MKKPTRAAIGTLIVAFALVTGGRSIAQERQSLPPVKKHTFDLDSSYITLPLPPSEQQYGRIDGKKLKHRQRDHRRVAQEQGRRREGPGPHRRHQVRRHDRGLGEAKFKEFGLQNVNRQWFDLGPQFFPTNWDLTATGGGKTLKFTTVRPAGRATTPAAGSISSRSGSASAPTPTSPAATSRARW